MFLNYFSRNVCSCLLLVAVVATQFAKVDADEERDKEVHVKVEIEDKEHHDHEQPLLDFTVRIVFELTPAEPESRPLLVLSAGGGYEAGHMAHHRDSGHGIKISGEVLPTDRHDRIRLTYSAMVEHHDGKDEFEAHWGSEGSAILVFGKPLTLANLAEQTLSVTATRFVQGPELTHKLRASSEFYVDGPQQARPPDGTLDAGTKVVILHDAGSYTRVRTEDDREVFVATDAIGPVE